ncbi:MAG: hypothetical protein WA208_17025 [Thermoanaerobaculia bacterium]
MSTLLTIIGLVLLAGLVVFLIKSLRKDHIDAFLLKRQPTSKIATRAEFVEGTQRIPVALSLAPTAIYYESPDLEASFDLDRLDEIEYADELATGMTIDSKLRVLRLRSHGHAVEFLLEHDEAQKWQTALPATARTPAAQPPAQVM